MFGSGPDNELTCKKCGHAEWWEDGNLFGEKTDFAHHWCGHPGKYRPCGPDCDHDYTGSAYRNDHIQAGEFCRFGSPPD